MSNINISNQFTIIDIPFVRKDIEKAINSEEDIKIELTSINTIDISAIQYLIAVKNEQIKRKKNIEITIDCDSMTKQLIGNSGFGPLFNL